MRKALEQTEGAHGALKQGPCLESAEERKEKWVSPNSHSSQPTDRLFIVKGGG